MSLCWRLAACRQARSGSDSRFRFRQGSGSGGGSGAAGGPFTIGGTVVGLTGTGLILQDNGGDDFPVTAPESSTLRPRSPSGGAYKVTAKRSPPLLRELQRLQHFSGTALANVTNVQVTLRQHLHGWRVGFLRLSGFRTWCWRTTPPTNSRLPALGTSILPSQRLSRLEPPTPSRL